MTPVVVSESSTRTDLPAVDIAKGWESLSEPLDSVVEYALARPGKLLRPRLLIRAASAVGGNIDHVLPAAIAVELGHVASLVHDDIIDDDDMRRGRPAVHVVYGSNSAIVAGDAMIFRLFSSLAACGRAGAKADRVVAALEKFADAGVDLCRGQMIESDMVERNLRDIETYLHMVRLKTGALFRGACESGALLGGGRADWVAALGTYGDNLGIAFQIQDDLLPYLGNRDVVGKPPASDVRNGRLTLPILLAYREGGAVDRELLDNALSGRLEAEEALCSVGTVLERTGAVASSLGTAREHVGVARDALMKLPSSSSRGVLADIAGWAVERAR